MQDLPVGDDHIWAQVFPTAERLEENRPTLFLDRDGVIVEEVHYLRRVEDVKLINGAAEKIKKANVQGLGVAIVTNQSGIARGYFDWRAFEAIQATILAALNRENGAFVDAVYACPFHKTGEKPYVHPDHPDRKPNPGMLMRAESDLKSDLKRSLIVGDKASDLHAGLKAGLYRGVHVASGHGGDPQEQAKAKKLSCDGFQVDCIHTIADLVF